MAYPYSYQQPGPGGYQHTGVQAGIPGMMPNIGVATTTDASGNASVSLNMGGMPGMPGGFNTNVSAGPSGVGMGMMGVPPPYGYPPQGYPQAYPPQQAYPQPGYFEPPPTAYHVPAPAPSAYPVVSPPHDHGHHAQVSPPQSSLKCPKCSGNGKLHEGPGACRAGCIFDKTCTCDHGVIHGNMVRENFDAIHFGIDRFRQIVCAHCKGTGKDHDGPGNCSYNCIFDKPCKTCDTKGAVHAGRVVCGKCQGAGKVHDSPNTHSKQGCVFCSECSGCKGLGMN